MNLKSFAITAIEERLNPLQYQCIAPYFCMICADALIHQNYSFCSSVERLNQEFRQRMALTAEKENRKVKNCTEECGRVDRFYRYGRAMKGLMPSVRLPTGSQTQTQTQIDWIGGQLFQCILLYMLLQYLSSKSKPVFTLFFWILILSK